MSVYFTVEGKMVIKEMEIDREITERFLRVYRGERLIHGEALDYPTLISGLLNNGLGEYERIDDLNDQIRAAKAAG